VCNSPEFPSESLKSRAGKALQLKNQNKPDLDRPPIGIELEIVGSAAQPL
jgi:hypothetical protein